MRCLHSVVFLTLALEALARAVPKQSFRDTGWERRWLAPRDWPLKLHIALRQEDGGADVERRLLQISDRRHSSFRKHLDVGEAQALSTPGQGSVHAVESWLWQNGLLKGAELSGGIFEIDATVRKAEKLLNTTYFVFSDGTKDVVRTDLFYLPDHVAGHIDFVTPTNTFPALTKKNTLGGPSIRLAHARRHAQQLMKNEAGCDDNGLMSPACIRQAYAIEHEVASNHTTFGIYSPGAADTFSSSDLQTYLERYNPAAAATKPQYDIRGPVFRESSTGSISSRFETALAAQAAVGLAWPARGVLFDYGFGMTYDPFVQFLQGLLAQRAETLPSVILLTESVPEDLLDPAYARRVCNTLAQIGLRGVTLLAASGDDGAGGPSLTPTFPSTCPYLTSIGGTTFDSKRKEAAATKSTLPLTARLAYTASSGGFSANFPRLTYQMNAVDSYIYGQVPRAYYSEPGFHARGRGVPDVSAVSTGLGAVVEGMAFPAAGTVGAAAVWTGLVALLNDCEGGKGRGRLGFLNPWLYGLESGLGDIDTGEWFSSCMRCW